MNISMSSPDLNQGDLEAVISVLRTRYLSRGSSVKAFEEAVASYVGTKHAVAVSSGGQRSASGCESCRHPGGGSGDHHPVFLYCFGKLSAV